MSPEQGACRPLSEASDWYAVGVMLYEVLTGELPFRGDPLKVITEKQTNVPVPPIEFDSAVPQDLNDLCMSLLEIEPENRPTATEVLRALGADALAERVSGSASYADMDSIDLVGREKHFEILNKSLAAVKAGETRSVFVHGHSGMGKSVLLRRFLDQVKQDEHTILLEGRCYEQETVPFKALDSLIDALAAYLRSLRRSRSSVLIPEDTLPLVRLFPVFGQVPTAADSYNKPPIGNADQNELRQRALNTLRELFRNLSRTHTLVLHIDDLQWGDDDSSNLLADLVRPPEPPQMLLLGSYRREELESSTALKSLQEAYSSGRELPHRYELAVDVLTKEDASRLALLLIGDERFNAEKIAERIANESRGQPFFVWELAQHVKYSQDDTISTAGMLELDEVIWSRVTRMQPDTRLLLEAFAVSGRPMLAGEVYQAIGCANGPSLLAQLRTNGFVRTTERDSKTYVESYHDRIRESVVNHISYSKFKRHNLRIAEVIEQQCSFTSEDIEKHLSRTRDYDEPQEAMDLTLRDWQRVFELAYFFNAARKEERAMPYALIAAERAWQQNAFEVAERQFTIARRGAESLLAPAPIRFRIAEGLGNVLLRRAQYDRANMNFETARQLARGKMVRARIDIKRGFLNYKKGDMESSNSHFHRALKEIGARVPRNILKLLYAVTKESGIQLLHTAFPNWLGKKDETTKRGQRELVEASIYDGLGYPYFFTEGPIGLLWAHLRHLNLAEKYPSSQVLGHAKAYHGVVMTSLPLPRRGAKYADQAYAIHDEKADKLGQGKARSYKCMTLTAGGYFAEAAEAGREAICLLDDAGDVWEANMASMLLSMPRYYLGELESAYWLNQTALRVGYETGDMMAVDVALYFGAPTAPRFAPEGTIAKEVLRERQDPLTQCTILQARALEQLGREDDPEGAAATFKQCMDLAWSKMFRNPYIFCGYAWRAESLRILAERLPEGSERTRALKKARKAARIAIFISWQYHLSRTQALREMGTILAMQGHSVKARLQLDDAIRVAQQQDARYELAKAQLARGKAAHKFGWDGGDEMIAQAEQEIASRPPSGKTCPSN